MCQTRFINKVLGQILICSEIIEDDFVRLFVPVP